MMILINVEATQEMILLEGETGLNSYVASYLPCEK